MTLPRFTWRIEVDTGGTFTDAVGVGPDGVQRAVKVLSTGALRGVITGALPGNRFVVEQRWGGAGGCECLAGFEFRLLGSGDGGRGAGGAGVCRVRSFDPFSSALELDGDAGVGVGSGGGAGVGERFEVFTGEEAPIVAARLLTGTAPGSALPAIAMRLATTRGTNALLTRRGARVALFVTRGFADLLEIGTQQRPDLFALEIVKARALEESVVEVSERVSARGEVLTHLALEELAEVCDGLVRSGVRSAAVALLHSDRFPDHERRLCEWLRGAGFEHVSSSSEVSPFIKIVPRATTAVVDAYLGPVVKGFVGNVKRGLGGGALWCLTSAGGLSRDGAFRAKDSLLSGPAGGVLGALVAGRRSGSAKVISFDMGGTSTDVARLDGDIEYSFEHTVGDATLVAPAVAIRTVAAGGGSVCRVEAGGLAVGPESAGADPGPACYGAGGPLTLTDVNLLLGRLDPSRFGVPIDPRAAESCLRAIGAAGAGGTGGGRAGGEGGADELLAAFLDIANERMAGAIRRVSTRAGYDPREYALVAFGGAGGQHACAVAARLGISRVVVPRDAGVLSARGLSGARVERFAERQVLRPLREVAAELPAILGSLEGEAQRGVVADLRDAGGPGGTIEIRRRIASMRLVGQESALDIELGNGLEPGVRFEERYRAVYGHRPEGRDIELVSLRVIASAGREEVEGAVVSPASFSARARPTVTAYFDGARAAVPSFDREELSPGAQVDGPAIVFEAFGATVVERGWRLAVDGAGALILTAPEIGPARSGAAPVRTEVMTSRLESIAREMGAMLERTAVSTNVKERLDFSCAVLDEEGELIACAPHVPVHLGSLGCCVRAVRDAISIGRGDHIVTNHPAFGGSHLPDITVISGVFGKGDRPIAYVASRAHHAEVGGTRPGSMPPMASVLAEEGVVIAPMHLVKAGRACYDDVAAVLASGPYPSRAVHDNLADLRAAVAANSRGVGAISDLAGALGEESLSECFRSIKRRSAEAVRAWMRSMRSGVYRAEERLDDGSPIRATITVSQDEAIIDLTGSAGVHPGNLNATPAIVRSVIVYLLRVLVRADVPLNEGLLGPVRLVIPTGIFNPEFPPDAARCPAVVGGNVETSQRLVDTLMKALSVGACSQGTMNNVVFGNASISYYETICGGVGAGGAGGIGGRGFHGASAVHSHMTNTRITDCEILETRYPVRLERFTVRRGSGGAGRFRGGDGVVREMVFLEPLLVSVLSQHRVNGPFGLAGGMPGAPGRQRIIRKSGEEITLGSIGQCDVGAGDCLIIETPGGGGYGRSTDA